MSLGENAAKCGWSFSTAMHICSSHTLFVSCNTRKLQGGLCSLSALSPGQWACIKRCVSPEPCNVSTNLCILYNFSIVLCAHTTFLFFPSSLVIEILLKCFNKYLRNEQVILSLVFVAEIHELEFSTCDLENSCIMIKWNCFGLLSQSLILLSFRSVLSWFLILY